MRTYYLYTLIDPNLKIPKYIGISNNPERRFQEHIEDTSITSKTKWISSLKKGGSIPILKVLKSTPSIREVCNWEITCIAQFKNKYSLTNTTKGGEYYGVGTPIDAYTLDCEYVGTFNSMIEFCELYKFPENFVSNISAVCRRDRNYTNKFIFRYTGDLITEEDKVRLQTSLNTSREGKHIFVVSLYGKVLAEFKSAREAEKNGYGKECHILSHLNHPNEFCSVKGNLIMYNISDYTKLIKNYLKHINNHGVWIMQYDLNGKYLNKFPTILAAANSINKSHAGIGKCLKNQQNQAYGYLWKYNFEPKDIAPYKKTYNTSNKYKPVYQYDKKENFLNEYKSSTEAAEKLNGNARFITAAANGSKKSAYGYIWKYDKPCN